MNKCKKCGNKLNEGDECFLGYCESCYNEVYEGKEDYNTNNSEAKNNSNNINSVARIIKVLAVISAIICIIGGLIIISESPVGLFCIIGGIVSSIFVYALGEIIQLLEDIKNK